MAKHPFIGLIFLVQIFIKIIYFLFTSRSEKVILNEDSTKESRKEDNNKVKTEIKTYDAQEEWFNSTINLLNNRNVNFLEKNVYSYKFQFILPSELPASLKHEYGRIKYSIVAFIDHPL